ncbi:MAG: hypothetical protein ABW098_18590 [Candidatus Thiodiazotropha sp.]
MRSGPSLDSVVVKQLGMGQSMVVMIARVTATGFLTLKTLASAGLQVG